MGTSSPTTTRTIESPPFVARLGCGLLVVTLILIVFLILSLFYLFGLGYSFLINAQDISTLDAFLKHLTSTEYQQRLAMAVNIMVAVSVFLGLTAIAESKRFLLWLKK